MTRARSISFVEVGPRDVAGGNVAFLRRDRLYKVDGKLNSVFLPRKEFVDQISGLLEEMQTGLFSDAKTRLNDNIRRNVTDLKSYFKSEDKFAGWVEVQWSRPTGAALDKVVEQLKALKITIRNTPLDAPPADGTCFFTGEPAVERILIGRTY